MLKLIIIHYSSTKPQRQTIDNQDDIKYILFRIIGSRFYKLIKNNYDMKEFYNKTTDTQYTFLEI